MRTILTPMWMFDRMRGISSYRFFKNGYSRGDNQLIILLSRYIFNPDAQTNIQGNIQTNIQVNTDEELNNIFEHIQKHPEEINKPDLEFVTPLMIVCINSHLKEMGNLIDLLITSGADVNFQETSFQTTLFSVCVNIFNYKVTAEIVKKLLRVGADPNINREDKTSPLMWICGSRCNPQDLLSHLEIAKMLLEYGADVNYQCPDIGNALFLAYGFMVTNRNNKGIDFPEMVKLILQLKGSEICHNILQKLYRTRTSLQSFKHLFNLESARYLIDKIDRMDSRSARRGNVLDWWLEQSIPQSRPICRILLEYGCVPNRQFLSCHANDKLYHLEKPHILPEIEPKFNGKSMTFYFNDTSLTLPASICWNSSLVRVLISNNTYEINYPYPVTDSEICKFLSELFAGHLRNNPLNNFFGIGTDDISKENISITSPTL